MATQTLEFNAASGLTPTVKLFVPGTDTVVDSQSATERTNNIGTYTVNYTDAPADTYEWKAIVSGKAIAAGLADIEASTATYYAYDRASPTLESNAADAASDAASAASSAAAAASAALSAASVILQATTIATLASQTEFTLTAGSADDDAYNDKTIIVVDQSTSTQKAVVYVADYVGATKTVKLLEAPVFTIATGDSVYVVHGTRLATVEIDAGLTSSAGTTAHASLWLSWEGKKIDISGDTCTVAFQRLDQDTPLFSLTEADYLGSAAVEDGVFRLTKSSPGFTDDYLYVVTATITHNGRAFSGTRIIPCLGGA